MIVIVVFTDGQLIGLRCLYFTQWKAFKIIGDNVDKSVRARHQTLMTTDQSLHYFHSVAVMDRVDFSDCSDDAPPEPTMVDVAQFLVTPSDVSTLLDRFRTFIKRYVYLVYIHLATCNLDCCFPTNSM